MNHASLPKVNIILAVYNGEKHLKKQLDSLLTQSYNNIDIYIRDDGSSDGSIAFITNYIKQNQSSKNIFLIDNNNQNLKCPESFYEIIRHCQPSDYYALCDQDDYWYPDKIQRAVEALSADSAKDMLLYFSACDYLTEDGQFIRKSPIQKKHLQITDVLFHTPGSGFTIVFNEAVRQQLILDIKPGPELHDRWLIRGVVCFGTIIYDSKSSAAHIRHDSAVTAGDSDNKSLLIHFIKNELCGDSTKTERAAVIYFYQTFQNRLTSRQKKQLMPFVSPKKSIISWVQRVFYPKRLRSRIMGEIALRILFALGRI